MRIEEIISRIRLNPQTADLGVMLMEHEEHRQRMNQVNFGFAAEAERHVKLAEFPDGAKVTGDGDGYFTLTLADGKVVMNDADGETPYAFTSVEDAYGRWLVLAGKEDASPFYGKRNHLQVLPEESGIQPKQQRRASRWDADREFDCWGTVYVLWTSDTGEFAFSNDDPIEKLIIGYATEDEAMKAAHEWEAEVQRERAADSAEDE